MAVLAYGVHRRRGGILNPPSGVLIARAPTAADAMSRRGVLGTPENELSQGSGSSFSSSSLKFTFKHTVEYIHTCSRINSRIYTCTQ